MIDNIVDLVQAAVWNIDSGRLIEDTEGFGEFAVILQKATVELGNAIRCLRRHQAQAEEMCRLCSATLLGGPLWGEPQG